MTAYTQDDKVITGSGDSLFKKQYSPFSGGAFELIVTTNFREKGAEAARPTQKELEEYEKKEKEKREGYLLLFLMGLGGVFVIVMLIFCYQAICGRHAEYEYQKRARIYKKQDSKIRGSIMKRRSTSTLNVNNKTSNMNLQGRSYMGSEQQAEEQPLQPQPNQ